MISKLTIENSNSSGYITHVPTLLHFVLDVFVNLSSFNHQNDCKIKCPNKINNRDDASTIMTVPYAGEQIQFLSCYEHQSLF